jgi:hypothetical protein
MAKESLAAPGNISEARDEFIKILEHILRKKGHRDLLSLVLAGFAHQKSMRMLEKWWLISSSDPASNRIFGHPLSGAQGWKELEPIRQRLSEWASEVSARRSTLEWSGLMWRVNHELRKRLLLTGEEILRRSQAYASKSPVPDKWWRFRVQGWMSGPSTLNDLDDLISIVILQRNVITAQRYIGKGLYVILGKLFAATQVDGDPDIRFAIDLYDARNRVSLGGLPGSGTGSMGANIATKETADIVITWMDIRGHRLLSPADEARFLKDHDPIVPIAIDARSLAPALVFPESVTKETVASAMVLSAAWRRLEKTGGHLAKKRGVWTQHGYLDCSRRRFMRELARQGNPIPGSSIALRAEDVVELLQPSALHVIYPVGRRVIIDLLKASHAMDQTIYRAADGSNANAWASDFENQVQRIIDQSAWRPSDDLRHLIGRVIRDDKGDALTDIDAVAFTQNTIILIDAKAFRVSAALAEGEHSATRAMRERVEFACSRWRDVVSRIRDNPKLLGIPTQDNVRIDGLIVLPFIPYVHKGAALEPVFGLLRASSVSELLLVAGLSGEESPE